MKTKKLSLFKPASFIILWLTLLFTGCQEQNEFEDPAVARLNENLAIEQTEIDNTSEGINALIDNAYTYTQTPEAGKSTYDKDTYLPACVSVTKTFEGNTKKVIIDFGEGCTTRNDNNVSGKIIMEFTFGLTDRSVSINYSFEDFFFNGKKIEGSINKVKIRLNDNGNPQATITKNIKIIWDDGSFVNVTGERIREWIEGFENRIWSDNVFLITGKWTITRKDGSVREAVITKPLKREMSCKFLVSGVIEIRKDNNMIKLDYGDGTCDDLAIVNINGTEKEIHIKTRRRK